jgi:hypothetical protein
MPAIAETNAPRLTLESFDIPGAPPDDFVLPPSKGGEAPPPQATPPPAQDKTEPPIKPLSEEPETTPDAPPTPEKKDGDEPPASPDNRSLTDAFEDPAGPAAKEAAEKAEADKKQAEEAAAAEKVKAEGTPPPTDRDSDLKLERDAHVHPSTRKKFEAATAKTRAARDERDAAIARAAELEKRALAAEEKAKNAPAPKELEDEVKSLREKVRELDISKDPEIVSKFDAPVEVNNKAIIGVLQNQGLGKESISHLVDAGLTRKNILPYVTRLRNAAAKFEADAAAEADPETAAVARSSAATASLAAEELSDLVRENERFQREKQTKIESWKGNYAQRQQERTLLTKQQEEAQTQAYRNATDLQLKADMAELEKSFPHLKQPPAPLPTDIPATHKAKQAALDEWTAAGKAVESALAALSTDNVSPEKRVEIVGRIQSAAMQAQVIKHHVLPRVMKDIARLTERNKELELELGKIRDAGKLSRLHSSGPSDSNRNTGPEPKSLEEAFSMPPGM